MDVTGKRIERHMCKMLLFVHCIRIKIVTVYVIQKCQVR